MGRILRKNFFNRPTLTVAKELLGTFLVRKITNRKIAGMITEVEAYVGPRDKASHASRGITPRTKIMLGDAGRWYVYMIYGMHHCLNIVTERKGYPAAILIRSVALTDGELKKEISGPGRVCQYFEIDRRLNGTTVSKDTGLWIEDRCIKIKPRLIKRGTRIGVGYAGIWAQKPWRFSLQ